MSPPSVKGRPTMAGKGIVGKGGLGMGATRGKALRRQRYVTLNEPTQLCYLLHRSSYYRRIFY
jgi:hypothetical protein